MKALIEMTVRLLIKGRVQGVFYRATAKEVATQTGIKGWVMNTPEGNVEAVASGSEQQVQAFIDWCHQGPDRARVDEVVVETLPETDFPDFSIKR